MKNNNDTKKKLQNLFYGKSKKSVAFNRVLLILNIMAVGLFAVEEIFENKLVVHTIEIVFGVIFLAEYFVRLWLAKRKLGFVFGIINIIDLIVIASLFAPLLFGNFSFLRVIRALRILRTYRLLMSISQESTYFKRNEQVIMSALNLVVFIFIMTDVVYVTQAGKNDSITSYIDALYFTLTTLTTTGFGDITLHGTTGKVLAILIMVFGITLFVKLGRDLIRPQKVISKCPDCGLTHHDHDAIHCKHCGRTINIETEGS